MVQQKFTWSAIRFTILLERHFHAFILQRKSTPQIRISLCHYLTLQETTRNELVVLGARLLNFTAAFERGFLHSCHICQEPPEDVGHLPKPLLNNVQLTDSPTAPLAQGQGQELLWLVSSVGPLDSNATHHTQTTALPRRRWWKHFLHQEDIVLSQGLPTFLLIKSWDYSMIC